MILIEENDTRERYCRMLGHQVPFHYCRTVKEALPCGKIRDCWFELIPVDDFLETHYGVEERQRIFSPPPSRMQVILETALRAREKDGQG